MLLQIIIFVTGGAILALELLASRIMTPYFGVSLYIWSGILSITLIALALGYRFGGTLTSGRREPREDRLAFLFALMPAVAALAIVAACLIYPYLFYQLARMDLVFGSFIACVVFLFVPLLATSAMNPLLVALLLRSAGAHAKGDAGSGRVFFVSTIGSVAGVLVTAFGLIPNVSNFAAALIIAAVLAALPLVLLAVPPLAIATRRPLAITAIVGLVAALGLLAGADAYTSRMWPVEYAEKRWAPEATYHSLFGTVKVLKSEAGTDGDLRRMYFEDGLIQNVADSKNRSTSLYTYALEALAYTYHPDLRSALVLGIGAGMVPMRLAGRGVAVTAVDIDPASLKAARENFGFDPQRVHAIQEDARTFLRSCGGHYEVAVVDLFRGDGVPDYLLTRDFFRDLRTCLGRNGIAVFNTFADLDDPLPYAHLLTTLRAELPYIVVYRPGYASHQLNSFIVASAKPLPSPVMPDLDYVPVQHSGTLAAMLREPRELDQSLLAGGRVVSDARNPVAGDIADGQLRHRRNVVEAVPAAFLFN